MSSSEQKSVQIFHSADLPLISIPPPFDSNLDQSSQSDSSLIYSGSDFVFRVPPTPTSVLPSLLIPADLRSDFSHVALSSQTSEESDNPASDASVPGKKIVHRINRGRFQKGQNIKRKPLNIIICTKSITTYQAEIRSILTRQIPTAQQALHYKNSAHSFRDLYVPHGSQIMYMNILSAVFSLLKCTDAKCSGSPNLYQYSFRGGLQPYLLSKCSYCHLVIAEFPTSLPIRMKPNSV